MSTRRPALALALVLLIPSAALAQTNLQLWGNVTLGWIRSDHLTYELDIEPKVLLAAPEGQPEWRNLDLTPSIEYAAKDWMDLTGEFAAGFTSQTDDQDSAEVTLRGGVRFHLLSRDLPTIVQARPLKGERPPRRRLILRDYVRIEQRNFFYTGDEPDSSTWRFRNRFELLFPLNRAKLTDDGAHYVLADWEWFVPVGDPSERFANRQRIRAGFGVRRSRQWRFEAVYMWTRSRDTTQDSFRTSDNIVNVRVKRIF